MTPEQIVHKLASEVADVLAEHAPQFSVGRRYINGQWIVVVRRTIVENSANQIKMFPMVEPDSDYYGSKMVADKIEGSTKL